MKIPFSLSLLAMVFAVVTLLSACAAHDFRIASWPPALEHLDNQYSEDDAAYFWSRLLATAPEHMAPLRGAVFTASEKQAVINEWDEVRDTWFEHAPMAVSRSDMVTAHRNAVQNVESSDYWHVNGLPEGAGGYISHGLHQQDRDQRRTTSASIVIPVESVEEGAEVVAELTMLFDDIIAGETGWTRQSGESRRAQYRSELVTANNILAGMSGQNALVADWERRRDTLERLLERPLESANYLYASFTGHVIIGILNDAEAIENRYNYAIGSIIQPVKPWVRVEISYGVRT